MRLIVFFDLPTLTTEEKRQYSKFRKHLVKEGFIMMQKSVYSKIAMNATMAGRIKKDIESHKPPNGNIQILSVSERQYQDIEVILGEGQKEVVDTLDRFVVL